MNIKAEVCVRFKAGKVQNLLLVQCLGRLCSSLFYKVEDQVDRTSENRRTATCMATLQQFNIRCRGQHRDEFFRNDEDFQFTAVGCVAVGYSDTSVHMFCLHQV